MKCWVGMVIAVALGGAVPARGATIAVGPLGAACPNALFSRIQSAIDAAVPGTTIAVCPGVYAEQLLVTKRVRIVGSPGAWLVPEFLPMRTTSLRSGRTIAAAVIVRAPATIDGLAIDASAHGFTTCDGTEPLLAGLYVRGAAATVAGIRVTGNRSRLRANVIAGVHAAPGCEAAKERAGCAAALAQCGTGLWLLGGANRATATLFSDVDTAVVDEGVANVVR